MASAEGNSGGETSALFTKLGGSIFGASGSPQRVVTNIRGYLANRIGSIPDTGKNNDNI